MQKIIFALLVVVSIQWSCSKEATPNGNIKVVVHLASNQGNYSLYFKNDAKVILSNSNGIIATQYSSNYSSLLDFGSYSYGDYQVNVKGSVYTSLNGSSIIDHEIDTTASIKLDAPTKTVTFSLN